MKASTSIACALSICISGGSASATPDLTARSPIGAYPLAEKPAQILCSYLLYGSRQFVCGPPPMEELKKKCNEKATAERGEKTTCQCSDDPNYIRDTCN